MKERFSGISGIRDWLFRRRRTTNVLPAAEFEPPKIEQAEGPSLVLGNLNGREKRRLRIVLYESKHGKAGDNDNPQGRKRGVEKRQNQNGPRPVAQEPQANIGPQRRRIVVEKVASSLNLDGLDDEKLLKEIKKSKSEIPEEEILEIIGKLQTDPRVDLIGRRKKIVRGGPFKGYHEVRRGKAGRVLFWIDEENVLHVRIGNHDTVYTTGKGAKDPARSL
ncbi:MAG: hypothetical protein UX99_C0007G0029 [Candidatus Amesbacteria bacterium GW2011_GWB1_47_26]|uniref:Uncharacterized protein n=1 Tax=Candidatus Amesbacteria bacterium GW2011_GWC2_45_19 TaxID=1618366 RepID=A0A0G1Q1V5_9BACT|nr:MAG: hypothetical protein UX05_C0010G0007 [Candidatus Amesbacteria bacterium GW2011_GWC2_45_19]KKU38082.1 MAG: hypothetical protein UX52_C0011G0012 [Candidatus Amesbacteria bacterium GW2011_GWA1_46_35]KKU69055.1 MAG: hypothetical protein UX93_C0003G0047 [Microgenomates group bacterium GW2011_GWC1_47_20]KKU74741.1 MAG: hypothetical protein UX99_C0007G0029 [Candidatus Amesbacteria bacterium GW2011_GWB1_47_26]KKU79134.1 MAG: hypothetical protein UY06_C0029G0006 [Candidatus Amesbacteria bacteriu